MTIEDKALVDERAEALRFARKCVAAIHETENAKGPGLLAAYLHESYVLVGFRVDAMLDDASLAEQYSRFATALAGLAAKDK